MANEKFEFVTINIPYPKSCSDCLLFDDRYDYPTCYPIQSSRGYNFNIYKNKMPNCPLNKIKFEHDETAFEYE